MGKDKGMDKEKGTGSRKKGLGRKYVTVIVIAVAVVAALFWFNAYYSDIDASDVPVPPIRIAGQEVLPMSADVEAPVFKELLEAAPWVGDAMVKAAGKTPAKTLDCMLAEDGTWWVVPEGAVFDMPDPATWLGPLGKASYTLDIELPESMYWSVSLTYTGADGIGTPVPAWDVTAPAETDGAVVQSPAEAFSDGAILGKAGDYTLSAEGFLAKNGYAEPSGTFRYRAYFSVEYPDPVFTAGRTELAQGDILSLKLENVPDGIVPELETSLGPAVFTKGVPHMDGVEASAPAEGFAHWYAAVPVSNSQAPGVYDVAVSSGEAVYGTEVTVSEYDFDFQDMYIDTSVPSVADAVSGKAIAEFREKVSPLMPLMDEERYWDGVFAMPVDLGAAGFISTQFGEIRITNGDPGTRRSHLGMDLAVSTGTPVHATGAGKVLLAEFLLNTGNTVIIDHGGGLKSFYYHMDGVDTEAGAIVRQGDLIGRVGTTGYSTGPHLHFEMRIGEQPISPSMLLEPSAGLYSAE